MKSMAIWSALGGGAACAMVAGFAVESAGGFAPMLAKLSPPSSPSQVVTSPTPLEASPPAKSEPAPSPSVDRAAPEPSPELPAFDVVRVEPSGDAVIAGRAAPHASVELRDDGKPLAKIDADEAGLFVVLPDALGTGEHKLQLVARVGDGPESLSNIVPVTVTAATTMARPVAPKPTPAVAPVLAEAPQPQPSPTLAGVAKPALVPAPVVATVAKPIPTAVAVAEPSPVAQPAPAPSVSGHLGVAHVKTTDASGLEAEGSADPGARLRLKLNGSFVAEVTANPSGHWRLSIDHGLTSGFYALRAEALDAAGHSQNVAESSFAFAQRTPPAVLSKVEPSPTLAPGLLKPTAIAMAPPPLVAVTGSTQMAPASQPEPRQPAAKTPIAVADAAILQPAIDPSHAIVAEIRTTTVIKGDNLWDLARQFYGDGSRYADIYRANEQQIHNPSLIFIGQVFVVPRPQTNTQ